MGVIEVDSPAWVSPINWYFSTKYMCEMCEMWAAASGQPSRPDSLIAVAELPGWTFIIGSVLNFDSEEFSFFWRQVIPIENTNLPYR